MKENKNNDLSNLSIIDAVETLANIADLEFDKEVPVAREHEIMIANQKVTYKAVQWLNKEDPDSTVDLIRETFRIVHRYLKEFYKNDYQKINGKADLDGIKAIMVLVGEAANKIDRYTTLFQKTHSGSVTDLKEYRQLQDFYHSKIERVIDQSVLSQWILGLTKNAMQVLMPEKQADVATTKTQHIFIDLESVKNDSEYELFYLRKEDGTRFYNPKLIRNIKLISDFGNIFGKSREQDPLIDVKQWYDRVMHEAAHEIIESMREPLDRYFKGCYASGHSRELCRTINKAIVALMMASNSKHLIKNLPLKCCYEYFKNFLLFLREALKSDDYQKMIAYPTRRKDPAARIILDLVQGFCLSLFTKLKHYSLLTVNIEFLLDEAKNSISSEHSRKEKIWGQLANDYMALSKLMKKHSGGPLAKVIEVLELGGLTSFDPLMQENLPAHNWELFLGDRKMTNIRIPCPTSQEYINRAGVIEEFKGFVWAIGHEKRGHKHLLINLQDRTSWKEHFRCKALEEMSQNPEFKGALVTVSLPKDTEFYNQVFPYHEQNQAELFIKSFLEQISSEQCGFYFSSDIRDFVVKQFSPKVLRQIHKVFFSGKNVLTKDQRLVFIEIFYMILQLKLLELVQPETFSLTCKDGIDTGSCASCQLWTFISMLQGHPFTNHDFEQMHLLLFAPPLLIRERMLLADRFNRMIATVRYLENLKDTWGADNFNKIIHEGFYSFFDHEIFKEGLVLIR